jgi:outer membrane cobalamin receptor
VVNIAQLKSQPAASAIESLQGKAAGVAIITDGAPGSTPQIRVRGTTTINNNDPLYVIDGVPYEGKLSWLSQNDIESMQG